VHGENRGADAPTFGDYMRVLRRRGWVVVATVVAVVALSMFVVASTTPRYESAAQVLLSRDSAAAVLTGTTGQNDRGDPERFIQTQLQIAKTPTLAQRVLDRAGLRDRTATDLLAATQVVAPSTTDVITFRVQDGDRRLSARLADGFAQEFTVYQRELDQIALKNALSDVSTKLEALRRDGQADSDVYRALVAKAKEIQTLQPLQSGKSTVLTRAVRTVRVKPAPKRDLFVALAAGLLLGAILAFIVDALDRRVYSIRGLVDELGTPALGQLPRSGRFGRAEHLSIVADADGPQTEPYQVLGANLEDALDRAGLELPGVSVMLTATRRHDGKSTVVANLGVALALAHKRVVLVEADHRSGVHRIFGEAPRPGLIDVARGDAPLEDALVAVPNAGGDLHLLPIGGPASAFAETLAAGRLNAVLARLRSEADIVIIDAPPLLEGRGAVQLAAHVDAMSVVVSLNGTPTRVLQSARATVPSRHAVDLGFIATGASARAALDRVAAPVALADPPARTPRDAVDGPSDWLQVRAGAARSGRPGARP